MRPLAVLTAIILGSSSAITFGLVAVTIVFLILQGRHPQFAAELGAVAYYSALFAVLSAVAGGALYAMLKNLSWRWIAQAAMWFTVLGVGLAAWPR